MKKKLELSWCEVIPRTTEVTVELSKRELEDLESDYYDQEKLIKALQEVIPGADPLHGEIDYVEVIE